MSLTKAKVDIVWRTFNENIHTCISTKKVYHEGWMNSYFSFNKHYVHTRINKASTSWGLDEFTLLFQQALRPHVLVVKWDAKAIYIWIKTQALKGASLHWNFLLPSSRIIIKSHRVGDVGHQRAKLCNDVPNNRSSMSD